MAAGDANKAQLLVIAKHIFGASAVETEFRFHPKRQWRFDYAIPSKKIAIEYQGHGRMNRGSGHIGGHASVKGIANDAEKFNQARILGWTIVLFTALHFREDDRTKHKLTSPIETLQAIARGDSQ